MRTTIAWVWTLAASAVCTGQPAPVNPFRGMQEREEVYEFAEKPAVKKEGDKYVVTFAAKGACDATVSIIDADGRTVRHLVSGVLGNNAPAPFEQGTLAQRIEWDGKDDQGKPAPAGCRAKVGLGLNARFEQIEKQYLFTRPFALAVDQEGCLYYTTFDGILSESIHVFDRQGKYLRTILPHAADLPPEKVSLVEGNRTDQGRWVPRRIRTGGGWQFNWDRLGGFFLNMKRHTAVVTPDGRLALLATHWYRTPVAKLLLIDTKDGATPPNSVVEIGRTSSAGMAISPDGKWLYFAGMGEHHGGGPPSHAVMRTSLAEPGPPETFAGDVHQSGSDDAHFDSPEGVACDQQGNVYVADTGNGRIQVFKPDGSLLKTIPDVTAQAIAVHPKTGAIYVQSGGASHESRDVRIAKLGSLAEPAEVAAMTIESRSHGGWLIPTTFALDRTSDPPSLWFASGHYSREALPIVIRIEDRGDRLETAVDALEANGLSAETGEGDRRLGDHKTYLQVDKKTGRLVTWDQRVLGPDGLIYLRHLLHGLNKYWVIRYNPATIEYVPFEHGEPVDAREEWRLPLPIDGKPPIGIPVFYCKGAHQFQDPFCVAPNGDIYVTTYCPKEYFPELQKAGLPTPAQLGTHIHLLRVYQPDGKLKACCALPGLGISDGLRVGRTGSIYVVQGFKPIEQPLPRGLAEGSEYEESRWGSLVKFQGSLDRFPAGRIVGLWENEPPENPTHRVHKWKVRLDGALWSYGGVAPLSTSYSSCTCLKSSFGFDDYERCFVPAAQTCTVNVIDSNGNLTARLGGYGNLDSLVLEKQLAFNLPRSVAVTDRAMWVHDVCNRAIVRAGLGYHAEETALLP